MNHSLVRPVWVTGTGTAGCAGLTPQELFQSALQNRCGIENSLGRVTPELLTLMKTHMKAARHKSSFDELYSRLPQSKAIVMALYAVTQALESSLGPDFSADDGLILATTTGQISAWENELIRFLNKEISSNEFEKVFRHQPLGSLLEALVECLGFKGKTLLLSSACSASTQAIALGCEWIKQGIVKRCFVGGTEILCELTIQGFKSLQLLSSERAAPFDENRAGINLSEGAAFLCVEDVPRNFPLAKILGSGLSTDSHHMTAPHPEGLGSLSAMRAALEMAELKPSDIAWVHAHGTGSKHNDLSEGRAIKSLFGEQMPWVSSTKWVHGHALGASGALEAVLCIEALRSKTILSTAGLKNPDPEIKLKHPSQHFQIDGKNAHPFHILKNTLGFGGINASLVISEAPRAPNT